MADALDTMRSLVKETDLALAGTENEHQVAEDLSRMIHAHGLESTMQEFNYKSLGEVPRAALLAVAAIAGVVAGVARGPLGIVMFILGLAAAVLYVLELKGVATVSRLGIPGSSQNVIAHNPGASIDGRRQRPIVVVAHYDTPRASVLANPAVAWIQPFVPYVVAGAAGLEVLTLLLRLFPLPAVLMNVCWAIAIVAALPIVAWLVCTILNFFVLSPTQGANCNKASLAVVLGLLDRVRPVRDGRGYGPDDYERAAGRTIIDEPVEERATLQGEYEPRVSSRRVTRVESKQTFVQADPGMVRHGADVVRGLGILPEDCEIEYVAEPATAVRVISNMPEEAPLEGATINMPALAGRAVAGVGPVIERVVVPEPEPEPELPVDPEQRKDIQADEIMAGIVGPGYRADAAAPAAPAVDGGTTVMAPVAVEQPAPARREQRPFHVITASDETDIELRNSDGVMPPDVAVQSAQDSASFFSDDENAAAEAVLNDPTWGTSDFRPVAPSRRLIGDIPDPAVAAVDPFSVSSIDTVGSYDPNDFSDLDFATGTHQALTPAMLEQARRNSLDGFTDEITDRPSKRGRKAKKGSRRIHEEAERMKAQMEENSFSDFLGLEEGYDAMSNGREIGSWDNFNDGDANGQASGQSNPRWQGGAARAYDRRGADDSDRDLRHAAMTISDPELASRDIWFVFTGASERDNAGIRAFIAKYRETLRGSLFVNLECVGEGTQSVVLEEGFGRKVKADRGVVDLLRKSAEDMGRPLSAAALPWCSTDATELLRSGVRAVTFCGIADGVPANARSSKDAPELVDPRKIDDAVDILVEAIKRS